MPLSMFGFIKQELKQQGKLPDKWLDQRYVLVKESDESIYTDSEISAWTSGSWDYRPDLAVGSSYKGLDLSKSYSLILDTTIKSLSGSDTTEQLALRAIDTSGTIYQIKTFGSDLMVVTGSSTSSRYETSISTGRLVLRLDWNGSKATYYFSKDGETYTKAYTDSVKNAEKLVIRLQHKTAVVNNIIFEADGKVVYRLKK